MGGGGALSECFLCIVMILYSLELKISPCTMTSESLDLEKMLIENIYCISEQFLLANLAHE